MTKKQKDFRPSWKKIAFPEVQKDKAFLYAVDILENKIPHNDYVRLACQRFINDLYQWQQNPDFPYYYDLEEIKKVDTFSEQGLRLSGGSHHDNPFILLPWQAFIVHNIYGWKKRKDKFRRFTEAYIETAKGSGKSPLLAGMALKALCADQEKVAQGFIMAKQKDQAMVTFRYCVQMMELSPALSTVVRKYGGDVKPSRLLYKENYLAVVASDKGGQHSGPVPHINIVDEYHEHHSSSMKDNYLAGTKNRKQPLTLIITNSGVQLRSPCGQEHLRAKAVLQGDFDLDHYFAMVYGVEETDEPFEDETCWIKANPSLAPTPEDEEKPHVTSIPGYDYIRKQVQQAESMPSKKSVVNRLNFCRWVDAEFPWIDIDLWIKNEVKELSPDEYLKDKWCWIGLDLAAKNDLCAGAIVWDCGDHFEADCKVWTPKDTLYQRSERESVPYEIWAERGHITPIPGQVVQYSHVAQWIMECNAKYKLAGIAFDPWQIKYLQAELDELGIKTSRKPNNGILLVPHPQGFGRNMQLKKHEALDAARGFTLWMPKSIEYSEEHILNQNLRIKENPCLRMGFAGCVVVMDGSGNRRLMKSKSTTKIDPAIAFIMALGAATEGGKTENWKPIQDLSKLIAVL